MTNKDILAVLAEVYNRLYRTSFQGEQVMVIADCERLLMNLIQSLNKQPGETSAPAQTIANGGQVCSNAE